MQITEAQKEKLQPAGGMVTVVHGWVPCLLLLLLHFLGTSEGDFWAGLLGGITGWFLVAWGYNGCAWLVRYSVTLHYISLWQRLQNNTQRKVFIFALYLVNIVKNYCKIFNNLKNHLFLTLKISIQLQYMIFF